ncbi:MAG TPA: tetratricopeptide repeat-containing sensor histidine kinase [Mucilaginibacter sp.]|jgi:signal transduction histidine kinase
MKKFITSLLLFTSLFNVQAQKRGVDSLKKLIADAKEDTTKALLLNELGFRYVKLNPDSALLLSQQAMLLSRKSNFLTGQEKSFGNQASVFVATRNYPKALSSYLSSLKIYEKGNDRKAIAKNLADIGRVYSYQGDYRQCINYTMKAKAVAETIHEDRLFVIDVNNIGDSYEKLNILDSALFYTQQAYGHALKLNDTDLIGIATNNLGNIYSKINKPLIALNYYHASIPYTTKANNDDAICETTFGMAKVYGQLGKPDSSLYYAKQSIVAGQRSRLPSRILDASQFLTLYFKQRGQLDSALHYQDISVSAKDSLFNQEKNKEVQSLAFAERQRQQDIEVQNAAYQGTVRFYLMVAAIAFLVVVAFILWRNSRKNEKAKRLLRRQKEQIQTSLGELEDTQTQLIQSAKMASLGELTAGIAHEIQNPLNFVNNFSDVSMELVDEMQSELGNDNEGDAIAISENIKQNLEKIRHHGKRADNIVKSMLQHSKISTDQKEPTDINAIADEYLRLSYHGLRAADKSFNADMAIQLNDKLPMASVIPQDIGRVLLNLYNNAFYAVNQKAKTAGGDYKAKVELTTLATNNHIEIKVRDNGNGISDAIKEKIMQPFFTTKPAGEGTGLGLSLSYDIVVKGHGGSINVDTKEGEFTEFVVSLPL